MRTTTILALAVAASLPTLAIAQTSPNSKAQLETLCSQNPQSAACDELRRAVPPTTTGTLPGPGNPNRPPDGVATSGPSGGVAGAGPGGITPGGNP